MAKKMWADLTRVEIGDARDSGAVVAIPVGAIEQHGAHMPVGTDSLLSLAITERAAERANSIVLVAPALPYGFSPHHLSHPGTISLRLKTYLSVLRDMAASIAGTGFRRIVFVNGHGGNSAPLRSCIAELVTDGIAVTGVDYWAPAQQEWISRLTGQTRRFGHACEFETALMLACREGDAEMVARILDRARLLQPRTVQPWILPGQTEDPITAAQAAWPPVFQADDPGYYGDPAAASVETGRTLLDLLSGNLATFLDDYARLSLRVGRGMTGREVSEAVA